MLFLKEEVKAFDQLLVSKKKRHWTAKISLYRQTKEEIWDNLMVMYTGYVNSYQAENIANDIKKKKFYGASYIYYIKVYFGRVFFYGLDGNDNAVMASFELKDFENRHVVYTNNQDKINQSIEIKILRKIMSAYAR